MSTKAAPAIVARNKTWILPTNITRILDIEGYIYFCDFCTDYHVNRCDEVVSKEDIAAIENKLYLLGH